MLHVICYFTLFNFTIVSISSHIQFTRFSCLNIGTKTQPKNVKTRTKRGKYSPNRCSSSLPPAILIYKLTNQRAGWEDYVTHLDVTNRPISERGEVVTSLARTFGDSTQTNFTAAASCRCQNIMLYLCYGDDFAVTLIRQSFVILDNCEHCSTHFCLMRWTLHLHQNICTYIMSILTVC